MPPHSSPLPPPLSPTRPPVVSLETRVAQLKESLAARAWTASQPRPAATRLRSGQPVLDAALEGGLPLGKLCEWGLPHGKQGRALLLQFLAASQPLSLWAYPGTNLTVYPPAWEAHGVDLRRIYFVKSTSPVRELRPIFLEPLFKVIVLDCPNHCSLDEQAFLAKQAKAHGLGIFLLRPYLLTHKLGNPLAALRLNSWFDHTEERYHLETLRGFPEKSLSFSLQTMPAPEEALDECL